MDKYADILRKELYGIIDDMTKQSQLYVKDPQRDYKRRRKLPMDKMIKFMLQMQAKSIEHELGDCFGYNQDMPTVSAYIQQRNKLSKDAMPTLFYTFGKLHGPQRMKNGYHLIACDGSDICFASNPAEKECCIHVQSRSFCMMHLNVIQDMIGGTYLDAIIQERYHENEPEAMITIVERLPHDNKTIFTADRGYEGYNLMAHIQETGNYYIIRAKAPSSNGILSRLALPESGEFDRLVTVTLTRKSTLEAKSLCGADPLRYRLLGNDDSFDLCVPQNNFFYDISFRAVGIRISDGSLVYFITNLPASHFSSADLGELYYLRWGVETGFRHLKYTVGLNALHTKKAEFVCQEIFARLILYNFCRLIASHASIVKHSRDGSRTYKLNFSMVIGACRELLLSPLDDPPDTIATVSRFFVSIRQDVHFPRNKRSRKFIDAFYRIA